MHIQETIDFVGVEEKLAATLNKIHRNGPIDLSDFEFLSYLKRFHPAYFRPHERKLIAILGLFFKVSPARSLMAELYSIFSDVIEIDFGQKFTPVQADAFLRISKNIYFSFSAPTSAGKSYLFREIINRETSDIVIVVPSRALISEYVHLLNKIVDKGVLVHQFIEVVNKKHTHRRVYVITPERGVELFKHLSQLDIRLVLFDEAQISDTFIRGLKFDLFVRRIDKALPFAKKVFAHPFIANPEAQLSKHNFALNSDSFSYKHNTVGKIYLSVKGRSFDYFSPFETGDISYVKAEVDVLCETLDMGGTVLIYSSKSNIYNSSYLLAYEDYIRRCRPVTDPQALSLIEDLRKFIGASRSDMKKHSQMIEMMQKGIVLHHGSIPLKGRLIIEEFVNGNYAQMCFSTSTLIQGINMPFDIVWIDNFRFTGQTEDEKNLDLKNLIGRAGRTTSEVDCFDYGYVIIPNKNVHLFRDRILRTTSINPVSQLDEQAKNVEIDFIDIVEAIRNDSFNDDLHLTQTQIQRLENTSTDEQIELILDNLLLNGLAIKGGDYYKLNNTTRKKIKEAFQHIFIAHLRRKILTKAEKTILSAAIPIMLWQIQGKSFAEIVSLRYSYLTQLTDRRAIKRRLNNKEISPREASKLLSTITILRSPIASQLPNKGTRAKSLFPPIPYDKLDYDTLVFDTYDYLDKVIGLSLIDPLYASFILYYNKKQDKRALRMANYIRYGTNDDVEIWLLRYGFSFEDVDWIKDYVIEINDDEIIFDQSISDLSEKQFNVIERFVVE